MSPLPQNVALLCEPYETCEPPLTGFAQPNLAEIAAGLEFLSETILQRLG